MKKKDRTFTPDNLLHIRRMAAEGSTSFEIAESIGSTPGSVRVICSQHKIKIGRRRRAGTPSLLLARLPAALSIEFHRKAEHLQIPASDLAARLLAAIVESDLYEAVLDDKGLTIGRLAEWRNWQFDTDKPRPIPQRTKVAGNGSMSPYGTKRTFHD